MTANLEKNPWEDWSEAGQDRAERRLRRNLARELLDWVAVKELNLSPIIWIHSN